MRNLLSQAKRFFGISGIGWIIDFCIFSILKRFHGNLTVNNIISSWISVTFVFLFATRKVFVNHSRISLKWKYVIYLLYQAVLIYCVSRLLDVVNSFIIANFTYPLIVRFSPFLAKIVITPVTMFMNFFVMKGVIEKL